MGDSTNRFHIFSKAFKDQEQIPAKYTCDGENVSPPLSWKNVPPGTQSLALIVDDPDAPDPAAPTRTWVHWVLYNIPAETQFLEENLFSLPEGSVQVLNDWGERSYGGPCPPIGEHRYYFKLYALDKRLDPEHIHNKAQLEKVMEGHVLGKAQLMGTYFKLGVPKSA